MLSDLDQLGQHREVVGYLRALLYLSLNNKDEALRWLERVTRKRRLQHYTIKVRSPARFIARRSAV